MGDLVLKENTEQVTLEGSYGSNFPRQGLIRVVRKEANTGWHCGKVTEIKSQSGEEYLGVYIPEPFVLPCVRAMSNFMNDDSVAVYRRNQNIRDDGSYHMSILDPREYPTHKSKLTAHVEETYVWLRLIGLGRQTSDSDETYYCIVRCEGADILRNKAGLGLKDMHITLGFRKRDLYGVPKGESTLICPV
jgi:hypothetical protein